MKPPVPTPFRPLLPITLLAILPVLTACGANLDTENGGLILPEGFSATVVADNLGRGRHLTVRDDGVIYVKLRNNQPGGTIAALQDTDGDSRADRIEYFDDNGGGTGIEIHNGYLYHSSNAAVFRYPLPEDGRLIPEGPAERIAYGFPEQRQHAAKAFTFDGHGNLYVDVGAPSNACMEQMRTRGSPGMDPCPQLERQAGIWRFDAERLEQTQNEDGERYVTGTRHVIALDWHPEVDRLYFVIHGRDQLGQFFPDDYSVEDNAELPAEEFHIAEEGDNFGWPYTYWDWRKEARIQAPEYGGGPDVIAEGDYEEPIYSFPGHYAPNDMTFYFGEQFPERYRGGAFVAFHGSWNRAPLPQKGYQIAFVPFDGKDPAGPHEVFADGFKGAEPLDSPGNAEHRPCGVSVGPDGSLYVVDSNRGTVWKITYTGNAHP